MDRNYNLFLSIQKNLLTIIWTFIPPKENLKIICLEMHCN